VRGACKGVLAGTGAFPNYAREGAAAPRGNTETCPRHTPTNTAGTTEERRDGSGLPSKGDTVTSILAGLADQRGHVMSCGTGQGVAGRLPNNLRIPNLRRLTRIQPQ
jgi:hypothetical protein